MNRREMLYAAGTDLIAGTVPCADAFAPSQTPEPKQSDTLALVNYEPKSMLQVQETHIPRSRYPLIDIHTHLCFSAKTVNGIPMSPERKFYESPLQLLTVMDRKNIRSMVNLTGGYDTGLVEAVKQYDKAHPSRFYTFTEPIYSKFLEPNFPALQAQAIEQAHRDGARGLKILKTLGLYLRENISTGKLVKIDDPRFDPMWEACGALQMPVAIHISDPLAFFLPTDRFNERYEELNNHPEWSFYGKDFPFNEELIEARNRVLARHPRTRFVVLHCGNFAENLQNVAQNMDRFSNMTVDIAARIGELGRQPRTARAFFEKYQDRILFGTDATPHTDDLPQQLFNDKLYEIYFRFLETDDEYFDYAPANVPPQGRWKIYGVHLPDSILRKVYLENASRELHLSIA
jgi:predicted TIM-barrel fold metal-dependent hydrolase